MPNFQSEPVLYMSNFPFWPSKNEVNTWDAPGNNMLVQNWMIRQELSGVFHYLPLWLMVRENIEKIIEFHLRKIWAHKIDMSAFWSSEHWKTLWRDKKIDVMFKVPRQSGQHLHLNPTHEEVVTPLMREFLAKWFLPAHVFQTNPKYRDEKRAKGWLLRWVEFTMNDTYWFYANEVQEQAAYEQMIEIYRAIYKTLWISDDTFPTHASWWSFSDLLSTERQTLLSMGEDEILYNRELWIGINTEVEGDKSLQNDYNLQSFEKAKAAEVGNFFHLWKGFAKAFDLKVPWTDDHITMACYGIWPSRCMWVIAEKHFTPNEKNGKPWSIIRPDEVTPYDYYIITVGTWNEVEAKVQDTIAAITRKRGSVIVDDRNLRFWEKVTDAEMLWIPNQVVISEKRLQSSGDIEVRRRSLGWVNTMYKKEMSEVLSHRHQWAEEQLALQQ